MPYTVTTWINDSGEAISATNLNKMEAAIKLGADHSEATHAPTNADNTAANETSHANVLVDSDAVSPVTLTNKLITQTDIGALGSGDMTKAVYDTTNNGVVDNAEKVNGLTVGTAVPLGAVFTDTVYDDTALAAAVALNTAKVSFDTTSSTKVNNITVTQPVDLDAIETRINQLDASVVLKGVWDASVGTFPISTIAGESWIASVGGTVGGVVFNTNDRVVALVVTASTTVYAGNWHKLDYTDEVLSVAGRTGAVTLGKADVGLSNVDNTTDLLKPISTATQTALDGKVDDGQVLTNVPVGALFTDTVYTHPATDGSLHVPATSTTNSGKVLTAGATAGAVSWETPAAAGGSSLLTEYIVTTTGVTSIDFSGLDINTHKSYRIEADIASDTIGTILLYANNNLVNTQYYSQLLMGENGSAIVVRYNHPQIGVVDVGHSSNSSLNIRLIDGRYTFSNLTNKKSGNLQDVHLYSGSSTGTTNTNITQLTFTLGGTVTFKIGSKIRIYKGD